MFDRAMDVELETNEGDQENPNRQVRLTTF